MRKGGPLLPSFPDFHVQLGPVPRESCIEGPKLSAWYSSCLRSCARAAIVKGIGFPCGRESPSGLHAVSTLCTEGARYMSHCEFSDCRELSRTTRAIISEVFGLAKYGSPTAIAQTCRTPFFSSFGC